MLPTPLQSKSEETSCQKIVADFFQSKVINATLFSASLSHAVTPFFIMSRSHSVLTSAFNREELTHTCYHRSSSLHV